jgi:hypothetical protein
MAFQEVHTGFTFGFDGSKFGAIQRGVKRAEVHLNTIAAKTQAFSQKMGGFFDRAKGVIGAYLGFRAVRAITTDYAVGADTIAKFSAGLGISAERYQELTHAAQLNGITIQELQVTIPKFAKSAADAADGSKAMADAFTRAGLKMQGKKFLGDPIDMMLAFADGLKKVEDPIRKAQILQNAFGRSGKKMGVLMAQGSEGIKKAMAEAKKLGVVLSKKQLKDAERFNDEMLRVKSILTGIRNTIASRLLPALSNAMEKFRTWWVEGRNAERALRALKIVAIFTGIVIARLIGASVLRNVKLFVQGIWAGVQALRAMGVAGAATALKIWAIVAAFALVALAVEDLIGFAQGKDSVIGRILGDTQIAKDLKKSLIELGTAVKQAWKELAPVLLKAWTDLKPEMEELWSTIKPLIGPAFRGWIKFITVAFRVWGFAIGFVSTSLQVVIAMASWLGSTWSSVVGEMRVGWAVFVTSVKDGLDDIGKTAKVIAKALGVDLGGAAATAKKAWDLGLKGAGAAVHALNAAMGKALGLKGLLFGVTISGDIEKALKATRAVVAGEATDISPSGQPVKAGLFQPQGVAAFAGQVPLAASAGVSPFSGPVVGGPVVSTSVAAGAVQLNFSGAAANDPEAVARAVGNAMNKVITDASRDLVKPPRGQT